MKILLLKEAQKHQSELIEKLNKTISKNNDFIKLKFKNELRKLKLEKLTSDDK